MSDLSTSPRPEEIALPSLANNSFREAQMKPIDARVYPAKQRAQLLYLQTEVELLWQLVQQQARRQMN